MLRAHRKLPNNACPTGVWLEHIVVKRSAWELDVLPRDAADTTWSSCGIWIDTFMKQLSALDGVSLNRASSRRNLTINTRIAGGTPLTYTTKVASDDGAMSGMTEMTEVPQRPCR